MTQNYSNYEGGYQNFVMLELGRRASGDTINTGFSTNRIGLLTTELSISTNKQSLAIPIPFSGIISGEAQTLAIDAGMPSRVDTDFKYRNDTSENAETTELPLIPFTWANRNYDIPQTSTGFKLSFGATDFPDEILKSVTVTDDDDNDVTTTETEIPGITGYLNNFDCSFNGQDTPAVTFNLSFTSAATAISDFINSAF